VTKVTVVTEVPHMAVLKPGGLSENTCDGNTFIGADVMDVDSTAWTLHSDEASLREAVAWLSEIATVILFHNFPGRTRKFAKQESLECLTLSSASIHFC
jgi:hypothetical protein